MSSKLLLSEVNSDVILKIRHDGYSWRMPAHSLLLASKSNFFQEMLYERSEEPKPITHLLCGMSPETALSLLNHIYKDEVPPDPTTDLLIASRRYELTSLRDSLEERFMLKLSLIQACRVYGELYEKEPFGMDAVKNACQAMIEEYSLIVFGSDLVLLFNRKALTELLMSSELNVPDESHVFWGVWRWCRRHNSKNDRPLTDQSIAEHNDDLMVLIRNRSLGNRHGIPSIASSRFDKLQNPRVPYSCPPDILKHTSSLRPCPTWEDILPRMMSGDSEVLCLQLSFKKDVLLVGMTLEACLNEQSTTFKLESVMRIIRELDDIELRQQKVNWCLTAPRRLSIRGDPERRLECEFIFRESLFLTAGNIYSVCLSGNFTKISFPWCSAQKKEFRIGNTSGNIHAKGVSAVREIYLVPDMTITWGDKRYGMVEVSQEPSSVSDY